MKKFLVSAAAGATLLGGSIAVAGSLLPAYAQSNQGQAQTQQDQTNKTGGKHHRQHRALKAAIKTAADTIGIQPKDLVTELRSGKSVADVANEHNVDPQKVVDAIVAKIDAKLDEAVTNGKITQERADELKAKAPEKVTKMVNAHHTPGQHRDGQQGGNGTTPGTQPAPSTGTGALN